MIREDIIKDAVYELYKQAVIVLGNDVKKSLEDALKIEDNNLAKLNIYIFNVFVYFALIFYFLQIFNDLHRSS